VVQVVQHQIEPDPAEEAVRYGAGTPVPDWHARLVCGHCGGRRYGRRWNDAVCGELTQGVLRSRCA
jgi:hypothetical protein